ncbi:MAG TPA: hypothetical protein EYP28_00635 [Methanophagales archaeon]|nr:hypothetical protein [Methanophagales archaeon]
MKKEATKTLVVLGAFFLCVFSIAAIAGMDSSPVQEVVPEESVEMMSEESVLGANYKKLQISPRQEWFQIKPGGEEEFTVKIKNKENESVFTSPRLEMMPYGEYMEEEWITFEPDSAEINAGEVQEYTVRIKIPEDAVIGDYSAQVVFTNDTMPTQYLPFLPQPNSLMLSINVWERLKILIQPQHIHDRVEAGQSKEYKIQLENKGDEAIAISPEIGGEEYRYGPYENKIPDEWLTIDAPATVDANSTATVNVTADAPDDAKGGYEGCIKLNIDDPSTERWGWDHEVHISLEVWKQPTTPYQENFTVQQGQNFSVMISASQYAYDKYGEGAEAEEEPSFDVTLALAGLEGEDLTPEPSKTVKTGGVSLGTGYLPPWEASSEEIYHVTNMVYSETYTVTNATGGVWTLEILPRNAESFEYTIEIGE